VSFSVPQVAAWIALFFLLRVVNLH